MARFNVKYKDCLTGDVHSVFVECNTQRDVIQTMIDTFDKTDGVTDEFGEGDVVSIRNA